MRFKTKGLSPLNRDIKPSDFIYNVSIVSVRFVSVYLHLMGVQSWREDGAKPKPGFMRGFLRFGFCSR